MSYVIFGRAIKNEYLALATLGATGLLAASLASGGSKKQAPAGASIEQVKDSVKINASSREEEEFIKNFIAEAEKGSNGKH